jgi:hypothetical protein
MKQDEMMLKIEVAEEDLKSHMKVEYKNKQLI